MWESNKCKEGRAATLSLAVGSIDDKYLEEKKRCQPQKRALRNCIIQWKSHIK